MTTGPTDRAEVAREVFLEIIDLAPDARRLRLDQVCAVDTALRAEVESLLAHDEAAQDRYGAPALANDLHLDSGAPASAASPWAPPRRIGRYETRALLASGGMGIVYEAVQDHPRRAVALKLLRPGVASPEALKRFAHESEILGRLHHPGIAQVYDAGTFDDGAGAQPYFVMELVTGRSLIEHAEAASLSTRDRLALFVKVCAAVRYAHEHGVIHRDLKPDNILVDEEGEPKILDFGVARATDADIRTTTLRTDVGQLVGTVPYMSPEQIEGTPCDLDTRSDVYALGVVLYELLTARLPYDLEDRTIPEAARVIREDDPVRLSSIDRMFRGDLETIVAKALEKERSRRYQSVGEFAADIGHFLHDEPIVARPPSTLYQLGKFARRNKGLVGGMIVAAAALVLGSAFATWQVIQATSAQREAERLERASRWDSYVANMGAGLASLANGETASVRRRLDAAPEEHRAWEWHYLSASIDQSLHVLGGRDGWVRVVAFAPNGRRLASAAKSSGIKIWDVATGRLEHELTGNIGQITALAFSPEGARLASASGDGTVRLWDPEQGLEAQPALEGHRYAVRCLAFSPDGMRLVTGAKEFGNTPGPARTDLPPEPAPGRGIRIWDVATGRLAFGITVEPTVLWVAFTDDGATVLSAHAGGVVHRWDAATGELISTVSDVEINVRMAIDPDRKTIATPWGKDAVQIWDLSTGREVARFLQPATVVGVAFSPDRTWLALGLTDGTVRRIDARSGDALEVFRGHRRWVMGVAVAPDGRRIATGSDDGTARLWAVRAGGAPKLLRGHDGAVVAIAFSPDGSTLASLAEEGVVILWKATTGERVLELDAQYPVLNGLAFSPDGSALVCARRDESMILWNPVDGRRRWSSEARAEREVFFHVGISYSCDSRRLAIGTWSGDVAMHDTATGKILSTLEGDGHPVISVAFHPDGVRIATGSAADQPVRIWDATAGRLLHSIEHSPAVFDLAFSPDGRRLATASFDGAVRLWDSDTGAPRRALRGHVGAVIDIAFSPDGGRLVSAGEDDTVRLWDTATGDEVGVIRTQPEGVRSLAFSPDGTLIVAGMRNGTIHIWDSVRRAQRSDLRTE